MTATQLFSQTARVLVLEINETLRNKALEVHHILCETYECPVPFFSTADPLSQLVSNLLSHRTKNRDSKRAFDALRERFKTREAVRDAEQLYDHHEVLMRHEQRCCYDRNLACARCPALKLCPFGQTLLGVTAQLGSSA